MHLKGLPIFEVCANGIESAFAAQKGGADRIELCERLEVGGITPPYEIIKFAREKLSIPIHVLIRPREGDFVYSEAEMEAMKKDIEACRQLNADGVVIGILKSDFTIDLERCSELIQCAKPLSVTFHRAFDEVSDPFRSLEEIIELGCDRMLTSGQKENALEGAGLIHELVRQSNKRITLLAGGGITEDNVSQIVRQSGANEFHFSAKVLKKKADGSLYLVSDLDRIRKICELARTSFQSRPDA